MDITDQTFKYKLINWLPLNEENYITYKETDATGYAGCTTTVKAEENGRRVSMLRFGPVPGQLIVEKGVRHICHYETGQGSLSLGLTADEIDCGDLFGGNDPRERILIFEMS